ncbi:hypothetical protein AJ80_07231 [Polytolypa hystricis UAMH7299]|uniref:Tetratricopeptide SHNi-TPR domain-containing protein n=1 Tax=Polytolypa hystricis (strain UAMH7299) TaxID=1447883 RepID=A0A2B7XPX8_POLH7|nr:hypothetical protein AJ80_07231 [Polytolypa hystricis UAMH7299]
MSNSNHSGVTPVIQGQSDDFLRLSMQDKLDRLVSRATAKDAVKDYEAAAELYSQATELQAELNGEMSVENANLLYAYGRSLYNVAVRNSDVLGSKVPGEGPAEATKATNREESAEPLSTVPTKLVGDAVKDGEQGHEGEGPGLSGNKFENESTYFQFTGDENFLDSDDELDEQGDENEEAGEEAEQDDFADAFEVLDLARVLLLRKLERLQTENPTDGNEPVSPSPIHDAKERLADIYDLQAEISLEGERFADAVTDLRASLNLKQELFPLADPTVAECHYKLSLALEFSSVGDKQDSEPEGASHDTARVNKEMRQEAAKHMEEAIDSCRLRISQEEGKLSNTVGDEENAKITRSIADVKEIVSDMEQRLIELRKPPVSINKTGLAMDGSSAMSGPLAQLLNQSSDRRETLLEEVTKNATDLSGLVKKKKNTPTEGNEQEPPPTKASEKRQFGQALEDDGESDTHKKSKLGDTDSCK